MDCSGDCTISYVKQLRLSICSVIHAEDILENNFWFYTN